MTLKLDKNKNTILKVSQSEYLQNNIQKIINSYITTYGGELTKSNNKFIYFIINKNLLNIK